MLEYPIFDRFGVEKKGEFMERTEMKARLAICSPILAISLMGEPDSSESHELAQGKVFLLRELPVKLFVRPNYSSKSTKSWCSMDDVPHFGPDCPSPLHLGSESPTYCAPTKVTSPPTHQLSPRLLPSRQPPAGSLTIRNFSPLITEIYLICVHPLLSSSPCPTSRSVLGTHSNRCAPPPPCLSCAFDSPKPILAFTYNSSLLS